MNTLFGMKIIENNLLPSRVQTLKVRDDVPMTVEGRAKMNAWLLDRFGEHQVAYMCNGPLGRFIGASPEVMRQIVKLTLPLPGTGEHGKG